MSPSSLYVSNMEVNGSNFLACLGSFKPTLRKIQLVNMTITSGEIQWEDFLIQLRDSLDLERFLFAGTMVSTVGNDSKIWHIRSHYDVQWKECHGIKGADSRALEQYILGNTPWTMISGIDSD